MKSIKRREKGSRKNREVDKCQGIENLEEDGNQLQRGFTPPEGTLEIEVKKKTANLC